MDVVEVDENLINYYLKIIIYLDEYVNNYEYILSLAIRDIKQNFIVYIPSTKKWYEYIIDFNKWIEYDFKDMINNISKFCYLFDNDMIEFLNNNTELTYNNKNKFKKICYGISGYIQHKEMNHDKIRKYCEELFIIDNNL